MQCTTKIALKIQLRCVKRSKGPLLGVMCGNRPWKNEWSHESFLCLVCVLNNNSWFLFEMKREMEIAKRKHTDFSCYHALIGSLEQNHQTRAYCKLSSNIIQIRSLKNNKQLPLRTHKINTAPKVHFFIPEHAAAVNWFLSYLSFSILAMKLSKEQGIEVNVAFIKGRHSNSSIPLFAETENKQYFSLW